MGISKWDLFKQIDQMPAENYRKIKEYLDTLNNDNCEEIVLDKEIKRKLENSLEEYSKGKYLTFDHVFDDGENNV